MALRSNWKTVARDNLKRLVGNRIRAARQQAGITQQELLERMKHKTIESISNVERGSTLPPLDTLMDFAKALGVDPAVFITNVVPGHSRQRDREEHEARLVLSGLSDQEMSMALRLLKAIKPQ